MFSYSDCELPSGLDIRSERSAKENNPYEAEATD